MINFFGAGSPLSSESSFQLYCHPRSAGFIGSPNPLYYQVSKPPDPEKEVGPTLKTSWNSFPRLPRR